MTLMDPSQGTEMERLWALLSELSAQLSHNRQQTEELHRRAEELKVCPPVSPGLVYHVRD